MAQPSEQPREPSDADQINTVRWDFRREGRSWSGAEFKAKHDLVPGRIEAFDGRLCLGAEQRLVLLALLLENIGLDTAVQLGDPERWREALAARTAGRCPTMGADLANVLAKGVDGSTSPPSNEAADASGAGSTWNYRVMDFVSDEDAWSAIHEVHYEGGRPRRYTEGPAAVLWDTAEGMTGGLRVVERMKDALLKPTLREADLRPPE